MNNTITTDDGYSVTIQNPVGKHARHPVEEGVPPCTMDWAAFGMNGKPVGGAATLFCPHRRMFCSPDMPVGFVLVLIEKERLAHQVAAETPQDQTTPLPDLLGARRG